MNPSTPAPDAPRYIAATAALLDDWYGPAEAADHMPVGTVLASDSIDPTRFRLDPMRPEVRDHLIRALKLPDWMRDRHVRDYSIEPWQSAGLIACAAAGGTLVALCFAWQGLPGCDGQWRPAHGDEEQAPRTGPYGWYAAGKNGKTPSAYGQREADAAALEGGCAIMLDWNTMALPWPGGSRVWRRP